MFAYANPNQKQKQQSKAKESMPYQNKNLSTTPNMTGIPGTLKNQFENFSGFSFDDVRVHYHSDKPAQLQARAYTQGNHVYLGSGQEKYLGHELGHVVQQKQGRVSPRLQCMGYALNNDSCLEKEADSIYEHSIHSPTAPCFSLKITENPTGIVQRQEIISDTNPEDLLYGCTEDRRKYTSEMDRINNFFQSPNNGPLALQLKPLKYPIIVDYMNNAFLGTGKGQKYGDVETINPDVTGTKKYQDFHRYFCLLMEDKIPPGSSDEDISTRINTACKFGIWLTVKMGHHIHFVLDSIYDGEKQEQIANGSYQHTAKELRYVRTNWEDKDFQEGLLFYKDKDSGSVDAPWISPFSEQWASYRQETLAIDPMAEYLVNPLKSKEVKDAESVLQNMSIKILNRIAEYNTIMHKHSYILAEIDNINEWINNELEQAGCVDTLLSFLGIRENVEERIRPKIELLNVLAEENIAYIQRLRELQIDFSADLDFLNKHVNLDLLKKYYAFLDSL